MTRIDGGHESQDQQNKPSPLDDTHRHSRHDGGRRYFWLSFPRRIKMNMENKSDVEGGLQAGS